jgi:hypothetical protein
MSVTVINLQDNRTVFRIFIALFFHLTLPCIIYTLSERYGFLGAFAKLRKATISFIMSFRTEQLLSYWTDSREILYLISFRKSGEKIQVSLKSDKNNGYFTEDLVHFLIISRSLLLRLRNVLYKICRENQNTHFMFSYFFFFENRPVFEIM